MVTQGVCMCAGDCKWMLETLSSTRSVAVYCTKIFSKFLHKEEKQMADVTDITLMPLISHPLLTSSILAAVCDQVLKMGRFQSASAMAGMLKH